MKKLTILALLLCSIATITKAQNYFPSSGNASIGAGSSSPTTAALEIAGGPGWTVANWKKSLRLRAGGAIQFVSAATSPTYFGIGSTTPDALYFFTSTGDTTTFPISYRMALMANGNIGIGTNTPTAQLDVQGDFRLGVGGGTGGTAYCIGLTRVGNAQLFGTTAEGLALGGDATGKDMVVLPNGNVGIGTANPQAKLAVDGIIYARRVRVTQSATDWPDYVFAKEYKLPALQEVETFVNKYQHLPEIPSAAEVEREGADLGEMNKKLLKKVEELTLYIIDMNKKQETLTEEVKELKKQLKK